jgi:protein SCO1/2
MTGRRPLIFAAAAALALMAGCEKGPPQAVFKGVDITGADYAKALSLPDVDGKARTLAEFRGKALVVFFGFTQCPDVCPTTLAELAAVKQQLGPQGDKLQAIFVTIDPERDTPELLKAYMGSFDPGFVALRGTLEQTQAVAKDFKVFFQKVPGREPGSYTMDHTAGAFVFDPQGRVRLFVRYGQPVEAWLSDIKQLLA